MILLLIFSYLILVFLAYGMLIESEVYEDHKWQAFLTSVFFLWIAVPFMCMFTLGKFIYKLNKEL